ncbi:MAG: molybdate ABC transporter permease subunit [gamma proteobacterium symbiont of Bathyaustriella thionipta]|nr:molybdate ABC transporter permease subunit [gamma proteobacterium symbiont of Bathyaustriella thionipta]MCU7949560.1 molybdate ABC transporter permease subunit [gamma proteobacterium symbiont of Bathyaustriella thionipta]MCU7952952.1 molybdate ABC transporter permease subunit [gamma proteobacterium symbiont of Bathyaustriella thionipta]MCU7956152.1 molybdate ABC transporter permease subunit [gamma proteobacterium symbiont of Bathyaustriella thionipta]
MFGENDLTALWITLKLAMVTTLILLLIGTPLAWWLARSRWRFKFLLEAVVALPLVLPPTVLGFYLLIALGPHGPIGSLMEAMGGQPLAFTFTGLVIGSVFYSMPFVVQPLQGAFSAIGQRPLEVAATLRASPLDRFFTVAVPLARPGFLTATVLGFAHTLGEFGVVLMIGGNIPGSTQVVSIAIYDHVESLEYGQAHWLSGSLLLLSFLMLMAVYALNRRFVVVKP